MAWLDRATCAQPCTDSIDHPPSYPQLTHLWREFFGCQHRQSVTARLGLPVTANHEASPHSSFLIPSKAPAQSPSYYRCGARNLCHRSKENSVLRQQDEQTILVLCSLFANSQNSKDNICGGIRNGATRATSPSRLRGEERIQYRTDFMRQIFFSAVPTQAETAWYSDSKSRRVSSYCTQIEICLASTTLHIQKE